MTEIGNMSVSFGTAKGATSVASLISGQNVALDLTWAGSELQMPLPVGAVDAEQAVSDVAGPLEVQRGERFAVSRRVAVMPIRGVLTPASAALERWFGWATYQGIEAACAELSANDDVSAVVLDMNCPGGMVMGMEAGANAIAALASVKPVHVIVNPLAASAAYFLASQATEITMTAGSLVGSIGVMRMSAWPVEPDAWGEKWGVHMSTHARAKNPNPTDEIGLAEIQRSLDESEAVFLDAVAKGRGLDRATLPALLSVTDDDKDGGATYSPDDAIGRGLADGQETQAAFYDRIFAEYAPPPSNTSSRALSAAAKARMAKAISNT